MPRSNTWDGRRGAGSAQVLLGPRPPHVWLTHQPAKPRVGQAVRFQVGWFDPQELAVVGSPEIVLARNGAELTRLPTHADYEGLLTELWYPPEPGLYEAAAALAGADAAPLQLRQQIEVGAAQSSQPEATAGLRCSASYTRASGKTAVRVTLEGHSEQPLLVLLTAGDQCAARSLSHLTEHADLLFPVPTEPAAGLRATIVRAGPNGFEALCMAGVTSDPDEALQVQVSPPQADIWPGTTVSVNVTCRSGTGFAPGATLTAWLVEAASAGRIERPPVASHNTPGPVVPGVTLAVSTELSRARPASEPNDAGTFGAERESVEGLCASCPRAIRSGPSRSPPMPIRPL